jgi:tetratricopeptide (TPR) repeat protein
VLIARFEELHDDRGLAEALKVLAIIRFWGGRCEEALRILERAVDHAGRVGDRQLEGEVKHWMGLILEEGPTPTEEALVRVRGLLAGFEDDPIFLGTICRFLGHLEAMAGRFPEAWAQMDRGKGIARELGLVVEMAAGYERAAGYVALMEGDLTKAEQELRSAVETLKRIGDTGHLVSAAADLGLVLLETPGREAEAMSLAAEAEQWLIEDDVDAQIRWAAVWARALVRSGDADQAETIARKAVARAWATDYAQLRAVAQEALAEVLRRRGRESEAADALRKAIDVHEAKGNVVSTAALKAQLAEMTAATKAPQT